MLDERIALKSPTERSLPGVNHTMRLMSRNAETAAQYKVAFLYQDFVPVDYARSRSSV
jgi:hypothetical protein